VDRRWFLQTVSMGLIAAPLAVEGQPAGKIPLIGILANNSPAGSAEWAAFRQSLHELGWIEGHNVTITYRSAEGQPDRFRMLAGELVQLKADVIVVAGPLATNAAREATSIIPIVFVALADPVASGYVTSLARPGGNLTGLTSQYEELISKQLQLLKEVVPTEMTMRPEAPYFLDHTVR
jgi:putative ABC transport system substrate-binding protein